jgi:membrane protein DedA with SNARE-associated domain
MVPPQTIIHLLDQYGYIALFLIAILEGPIITIIGAFLASQGYLNIFAVYLIASAADLSGDMIYYGIGRAGSRVDIRRVLGISATDLARARRYIEQHGAKVLLIAKYTQTGIVALPACGAVKMPVRKFLWYNVLGTIPKSFGLIVVGYFFGYAYSQFDDYFSKAAIVILGMVAIIAAYIWLNRHLRVRFGDG